MKKLLCVVTAVCLIFALTSCNRGVDTVQNDGGTVVMTAEREITTEDETTSLPYPYEPREGDFEDSFVFWPRDLPSSSLIREIVQWQVDETGQRRYGFRRSTIESKTSITFYSIGPGPDEHSVGRGLTGIEMLTNLRSITILTGQIAPNHFRRLESLPRLRTLRFEGSGVLTASFMFEKNSIIIGYLGDTTLRLESLEIVARPHPNYPDEDFSVLRSLYGIDNFTNLRTLTISGNRLSNLNELRNLTNLTHLNASNNRLINISALRNLTSLERVDLSGNWLTEEELRNNLPEHLINREGGEEWLQTQIAGQNFG